LGEVVRAPGVVWSTAAFNCRQIASEDTRLEALSRANETERHRLTRARNVRLVEWLIIPYYGWVAAARAGMLDDELKRVDLVLEDAGDRRQELGQFAIAKGCAATADAAAVVPAIAAPPSSAPGRLDATPAAQRDASVPRPARPAGEVPTPKAPPAGTPAVPPVAVFAQAESAPRASKSESGMRVEGKNVFLNLSPGADLDRIAADLKLALQQR
jgi:hypothetical protein